MSADSGRMAELDAQIAAGKGDEAPKRATVRSLIPAILEACERAEDPPAVPKTDLERQIAELLDRFNVPSRVTGSAHRIISTVARLSGYSVREICGPCQCEPLTTVRHIAIYLVWSKLRWSLPQIGRMFGGRHHTTVLHAIRKIGREQRKTWSSPEAEHVT